jgi:hypothetical protein
MTPLESIERLREVVALQYRPGVIVDRTAAGVVAGAAGAPVGLGEASETALVEGGR